MCLKNFSHETELFVSLFLTLMTSRVSVLWAGQRVHLALSFFSILLLVSRSLVVRDVSVLVFVKAMQFSVLTVQTTPMWTFETDDISEFDLANMLMQTDVITQEQQTETSQVALTSTAHLSVAVTAVAGSRASSISPMLQKLAKVTNVWLVTNVENFTDVALPSIVTNVEVVCKRES